MMFNNRRTIGAPAPRTVSSVALVCRLLGLVRPHTPQFSIGLLALFIGSGINLLFPEIVRRLLKPEMLEVLVANQGLLVLGISVLFLLQGSAFFLRSYQFGILGQRVYADLRQKLFRCVVNKPISFFDSNRASDIASRINSDAALVQDAVSVKLSILVRYGIQVVCGIVLMLAMSLKLTMATVVSVLVLVGISIFFVKYLRGASRAYQTELGRFTSFASECLSGVKIVRVLGAHDQVVSGADSRNQLTLHAGEQRVFWSASFSSGVSALLNVVLLLVVWYGLSLVGYGKLPLNELAAFILYGAIVAVSFSFCIGAYAELMQGLGGLERVFELIDETETHQDSLHFRSPRSRKHEDVVSSVGVTCSQVCFSYPDRPEQLILDNFSFSITPGTIIGLVGPSGSGKSTVVQLLCKLYEVPSGSITLQLADMHSAIGEISEQVLRRLVAWVPQEPQLFGFSIIENLMLGNPNLGRDEALKQIQSWKFLDFIEPLERGVDTVLGEHGTLLSGGQRQRLAIARALLRKPALLILDEATSGLDSESEAAVIDAVRMHIPQATILVVSHRLSTVAKADSIYVMQEGKIVQHGTHAELSATPGIYRQYSERQALTPHYG